jgi:hypothetical protein
MSVDVFLPLRPDRSHQPARDGWPAVVPRSEALTLRGFLALLPGVAVHTAAREFDLQVQRARIDGSALVRSGHLLLPLAEVDGFFFMHARARRVTPKGARWFIYCFRQGVLPKSAGHPEGDMDAALAYARIGEDPADQARAERARLRAYRERLGDPDRIPERDFTYKLLDDIFWRHLGSQAGKLTVGSVDVWRELVAADDGAATVRSYRYTWNSRERGPMVVDGVHLYPVPDTSAWRRRAA